MGIPFEEAITRIKDKISAAEFLTPKRQGGKVYACPFCPSSDAVSEDKKRPGKWHCFSCGRDFDVLDAIEKTMNMSKGDALRYACDRLGIEIERGDDRAIGWNETIPAPRTEKTSPITTGKKDAPPDEAEPLDINPGKWKAMHAAAVNLPYLTQERGIPAEVIARHADAIGYMERARPFGKKKPATWKGDNWKPMEIPAVIFLTSKNSFRYRFLNPVKFKDGDPIKEMGAKGRHVGAWNIKALQSGKPVFVCEGILDALSLEAGGAEAVAVQGTALNALFDELDAMHAAGKAMPLLVDAMDADKPGRDAAARLRRDAEARGVFVAEGVTVTGTHKDANDALRAEPQAFAERVAAVAAEAENQYTAARVAEAAADKKDDAQMDERKAEPPAESFPDLPKGARGLINPAALQTTELLFFGESNKAAAALQQAGAQAIGTPTAAAIEEAFRKLKARQELRAIMPAAIVDCLGGDEPGRTLANDALKPAAEDMGINVITARPVFTGGADAIHTAEDVAELVRKTKADFDAAEEEERREYYSKSAACRAISFWDETAGNKPFSSTGFEKLDEITDGGFYPGLYIVGAISSLGKTTFVLQVADYVAKAGRDVLYFSLEMSGKEILAKSFSRITHEIAEEQHRAELARPVRDILTGSRRDVLDDEQSGAIIEAIGRYSSGGAEHLHITEAVGTYSAEDIRRDVLRHRRLTGNWPLVVIDYLQILKAEDPHQTDKQATDAAVLTLKQMSRDFDIPVFCISSFNRDNYLSPINMAAFKESGAVEYSADVLLGLQYYGMDLQKNEGEKNDKKRKARLDKLRAARESDSKEGKPVFVQLRILKNRNGAKSDCIFKYFPRYNHYEPCEWSEAGAWMREAMTRDDLAFDFLDTINADGSITPEESREKADIALAKSMDKIESIAARRKGNGRYSDRL